MVIIRVKKSNAAVAIERTRLYFASPIARPAREPDLAETKKTLRGVALVAPDGGATVAKLVISTIPISLGKRFADHPRDASALRKTVIQFALLTSGVLDRSTNGGAGAITG